MGKKSKIENLYIYMNGYRVGVLTAKPYGQFSFVYDKHWLNHAEARPISLSLPMSHETYEGVKVESYFDNLLPDSQIIRKRIQARFSVASNHAFDLLSVIGRECVGSLQILSKDEPPMVEAINAVSLTHHQIARLLKDYKTAPLGMEDRYDFRISIAGAQEKTALLWHENKWKLPKNATPTTHIFKLPIGQIAWQNIKMAMAVKGKNQHYQWNCILPRHWLAMAARCQFDEAEMQKIIEEICDILPSVIEQVENSLPRDFPEAMANSMFRGMKKARGLCQA